MSTHVMIDLETMSTEHNAAIISIGAVKFDPTDFAILESFHVGVTLPSSQAYGLHISSDTVLWWLGPDLVEARENYYALEKVDLATALEGFSLWFGNESLPVWGNGATFDNVILRNAFKAIGMECPWSFRHDRCYRTFRALSSHTESVKPEVAHNALHDAIAQVKTMAKVEHDLNTVITGFML